MEPRTRSTEAQRREFFQSFVWQDVIDEVTAWLEDIHVRLETERDPTEAYRFQGRAEVCRRLFMIEEILAEQAEVSPEQLELNNGSGF